MPTPPPPLLRVADPADADRLAPVWQPGAAVPQEWLAFRLGDQDCAIDIRRVQEVRDDAPLARLDHPSPFVKGALHLQGATVPVVDLRQLLGGAAADAHRPGAVMVVQALGRAVGLVVDALSDVLAVGADAIRPAAALPAPVDARWVYGIGSVPQAPRAVLLLDIDALMHGAQIGAADPPRP